MPLVVRFVLLCIVYEVARWLSDDGDDNNNHSWWSHWMMPTACRRRARNNQRIYGVFDFEKCHRNAVNAVCSLITQRQRHTLITNVIINWAEQCFRMNEPNEWMRMGINILQLLVCVCVSALSIPQNVCKNQISLSRDSRIRCVCGAFSRIITAKQLPHTRKHAFISQTPRWWFRS